MGSSAAVDSNYIVLFDGICNLCSGSVKFIIKRDPESRFKFASLQSDFGIQQLKLFGFNPDLLFSIILIKGDKVYQKSSAALEIARYLTGAWPIFYVFKIVPAFIRDLIYDWISRNRYSFFGKKDTCWVPSPELSSRFID